MRPPAENPPRNRPPDRETGRGTYFDLISLDHDLEGPDIREVVAEALAASRNAVTPVVLHSMNPEGSALLAIILPHAQGFPFGRGRHPPVPCGSVIRREGV